MCHEKNGTVKMVIKMDYLKIKLKTILLFFIVMTLFLLTSCTSESLNQEYDGEEYGYVTDTGQSTPSESLSWEDELKEYDIIIDVEQGALLEHFSWEAALEEYLEQYYPIFHHPEYRESDWGNNWWRSDWYDFIEFLVDEEGSKIGETEAHNYGITYRFRNPTTYEYLNIDETPFLHQSSWVRIDADGREHHGSMTWVANRFQLFDLDNTGIPALAIYWSPSRHAITTSPEHRVTLHLYCNGSYEFVADLSHSGVGFLRDEEGRIFLSMGSPVAHMVDLRLIELGDEIVIEPILSTSGSMPVIVYNHLTGEYSEGVHFPGWRDREGYGYDEKLGLFLTRIEPQSDLVNQLMEIISERFYR